MSWRILLLLTALQPVSGGLASPFVLSSTDDDISPFVSRARLPPNSQCKYNSSCLSDNCVYHDPSRCSDPVTGAYTDCDVTDYSLVKYCAGYVIGHKCTNNGECAEGLCRSGICSKSKNGDRCYEPYQCTGSSICNTHNRCSTPKKDSVYPNESCKTNAQCVTGSCSADQIRRDEFGVNGFSFSDPDFLKCTPFKQGQSGCRTFRDCEAQLCNSQGVCELGDDGARCEVNYQCKNVCGLDGRCTTPRPGSLKAGSPCTLSSQCISNLCIDYVPVKRPSLDDPKKVATEIDATCDGPIVTTSTTTSKKPTTTTKSCHHSTTRSAAPTTTTTRKK